MNYELSKSYSKNESQPSMYMFEIKITNNENEIITKRLSTMNKEGYIMKTENNIKNIKITVICMENLKTTTIKKKINNMINEQLNNDQAILLYKDNIIIIMNMNDDNINIKYQII